MEDKIKVNNLYELWDIAEEMMREDIEQELRAEWEKSYERYCDHKCYEQELRAKFGYDVNDDDDDDEFEEFDYEEKYDKLRKISDYQIDMITWNLLEAYNNGHYTDKQKDEAFELIKRWWRHRPERLDCNEFWEICWYKFSPDCYDLMCEFVDKVEMDDEE